MQGERRGTSLRRCFWLVGCVWIEAHALLLPERIGHFGTIDDRALPDLLRALQVVGSCKALVKLLRAEYDKPCKTKL